MFKRKVCKNCGEKINSKYEFCPYCGEISDNYEDDDLGMLGKDDYTPSQNEMRMPAGFNMIFNTLMKNLEKQFKELDKETNKKSDDNKNKVKKQGFSINISAFGDKPPSINIKSYGNGGNENRKKQEEIKKTFSGFSSDKIEKLRQFQKEEPKTNIKRLSDRVIYEIEMPGIDSTQNVSIVNLESSIEVKGISESKEKVYSKTIPVNMPISNYKFSKGKLILEFSEGN